MDPTLCTELRKGTTTLAREVQGLSVLVPSHPFLVAQFAAAMDALSQASGYLGALQNGYQRPEEE